MVEIPASNVTALLVRWQDGEQGAMEALLPLVYDELRRLARSYLRKERIDHTLQPTALVHEAYVRMADREQPAWRDRVHFFSIAARVMRQVLVDHARSVAAVKRGGDVLKVPLEEGEQVADHRASDLLLLNDALERLSTFDERKARIIELRFFAGLTIDECARVLDVSTPTVINDTRKARAWLYKEIAQGAAGADGSGADGSGADGSGAVGDEQSAG